MGRAACLCCRLLQPPHPMPLSLSLGLLLPASLLGAAPALRDFWVFLSKSKQRPYPHTPHQVCVTAPPSSFPLGHTCPLPWPEMVALEVYTEGGEHQGFIRCSSPHHGTEMYQFTKLRGAYAPARICQGKEWRAAFGECGHLEYPGVPFGLCQCPATLQGSVTTVFSDLLDGCVPAYLGDTPSLLEVHRGTSHLCSGCSFLPPPSSVCKAADMPPSSSHWASGVLSGHPCYVFYLQKFVASLPAFCARASFSAVVPHWWWETVVIRGLCIESCRAAGGLWSLQMSRAVFRLVVLAHGPSN